MILAIDPGTTQSAFVMYDKDKQSINGKGIIPNDSFRLLIAVNSFDHLVVEQVKSYGMLIGDSTLTTWFWVGRFVEMFGKDNKVTLLPRKTIVTTLCGSARAKDKNVRQSLMDRFRELYPVEGNERAIIGTKKQPGPLYGVSKDIWSALGVAVAWCELNK